MKTNNVTSQRVKLCLAKQQNALILVVTAYLCELGFSAIVASKRKDELIDWVTIVLLLGRQNSVKMKSIDTEV